MCQALSWTPGVHQGARTDKDLALWSLIPSRGGGWIPCWKVLQDSVYAQSRSPELDWQAAGLAAGCSVPASGAPGACTWGQSWSHLPLPLLQLRGQLYRLSLRLLPGMPQSPPPCTCPASSDSHLTHWGFLFPRR